MTTPTETVPAMVERVARALEPYLNFDDVGSTAMVERAFQAARTAAARAAIAAMAEPTPEMIGAGGVAVFKSDLATAMEPRAGVVASYGAMIAAALG